MKKAKTPSKVITKSTKSDEMICYHCGKEISNAVEVVFKPVYRYGRGRGSYVNRMFHMKCLDDFVDKSVDVEFKQAEYNDWDKCYQYFKKEFMQTDRPLQEHAIRRLLGLRVGMYYPSGNNTRVLERGYPFSTIYKAMVIAKFKARAYADNIQFTDYNHKVNTFMKFIVSEVADVQMRIDKLEKDNKALERAIEKKEAEGVTYVNYLEERLEDNKKNKAVEKVEEEELSMSDLWGIDLDVEED